MNCLTKINGQVIGHIYTSQHRAKSEISYVFYVHDRCRIGLIHMSATNPIEESILPCFLHCGIYHLSCNQSYRGNLNNPVVFLHCGICHLSCNQSWMGNLNNPAVFLHCGICHLSCNQSWMGNLNNPVVFLHCGIFHLSCNQSWMGNLCVPTLWDMSS